MRTMQWWPYGRRRTNVWAGIASGLVGGLVGTWTMSQYVSLAEKAQKAVKQLSRNEGNGFESHDRQVVEDRRPLDGEGEKPATVKAAAAVSERVFHHRLTPQEEEVAGGAVHYAFGTLMGGVYGGLAEVQPMVKAGAGLPFGAALFLGADELAVPALRLGPPPQRTPVATHVNFLVAHLVWGAATEGVRGLMRRMF